MLAKIVTLWRLGVRNLVWVVLYRAAVKLGLVTRNMHTGLPISGPFFIENDSLKTCRENEALFSLDPKIFGWINYEKERAPDWNKAFISGKRADFDCHWSKISDFDLEIGDIKTVWEISRFDWVSYFVVEYLRTKDVQHLQRLNEWIEDWSKHNPVNVGVNWKCGQEASFRVLNLCLASFCLKQNNALTTSLQQVLTEHLQRISPTVLYAMAQDNNHGTSEAAALYVGGLLLEQNVGSKQARYWKNKGRRWIENRASRIILNDGSFSQYSLNYHRVMLDCLSLVEYARRRQGDKRFSNKFYSKMQKAEAWLYNFVDSKEGDGPNIGANDGAQVLPLTPTEYRDYRPSVQLASVLFSDERAYISDPKLDQGLMLLGLDDVTSVRSIEYRCKEFLDGGFVKLCQGNSRCFVRFPKYKFRPSQCDALHVDLWVSGLNLLRDAGSYSYNASKELMDYFPSTQAHNTAQFDQQEQMPKLSRFLYSHWLSAKIVPKTVRDRLSQTVNVGYSGRFGESHSRELVLGEGKLLVKDHLKGIQQNATLRWRLIDSEYQLIGNKIVSDRLEIHIESSCSNLRVQLVEGLESRYYLKKSTLPVVEICVESDCEVTSKFIWEGKRQ